MKIAVCTVWGNDPLIIRMIESIPKEWDIYLVEGQFTNSKVPSKCDSELVKKVKQYDNVYLLHRDGMEFEVRNKYLEVMEGYDFALMLDSDEFIVAYSPTIFMKHVKTLEENYYLVDMMYGSSSKPQGRFFVNPYNWRYVKSHKYIKNGDKTMPIYRAAKPMIEGLLIRHDDSGRPEDLKQSIEEYQKQLWEYEDTLELGQ